MSGQTEKVIEHSERRFALEPNFGNGVGAMNAALLKGEPESVIKRIKPFLLLDPQNTFLLGFLANAYIHTGEYDLARETIDKIILIDPDAEKTISYLLEAIDYLQSDPDATNRLTRLEGTYRNSHGAQLSYHEVISSQIFNRAKNQFGEFMFPAGDNILIRAHASFAYRKEFLVNEQGNIYAIKNTNINSMLARILKLFHAL